jgi:mRNA interferase RelE/StbE
MRKVSYSRDAAKTLARIPANTARLIRGKVDQYAADPESLVNNVKAMQGQPGYHRLRVGDWRVIFRETLEVVAVERVAPRGSAYGE